MIDYDTFLEQKRKTLTDASFECGELHKDLFPFQAFCVRTALRKGKFALFEDCGLGKTFQQLVWAAQIVNHTGGEVLILAPLAVRAQTEAEAKHFDISLFNITITNYEQLDNIDCSKFVGPPFPPCDKPNRYFCESYLTYMI